MEGLLVGRVKGGVPPAVDWPGLTVGTSPGESYGQVAARLRTSGRSCHNPSVANWYFNLSRLCCLIIMSNATASYKQLKEDFVSNLTGGPVSEIAAVTAVLPVGCAPPPSACHVYVG